jgi:hypothetical protein
LHKVPGYHSGFHTLAGHHPRVLLTCFTAAGVRPGADEDPHGPSIERPNVATTNETTTSMPDTPHLYAVGTEALAARQQAAADRETTALQLLAENLTEVPCGIGRRALGVHVLLAVEKTLSDVLGPCGKHEYQRVVDHYLRARHGHIGGVA